MSLVGNLEDLGLGEILQIVSLSRKSGSLSLHSRGREGKIVFRNGQVVSAASTSFQESLGELLVRRGLVDRHCLRKALAIQREGTGTARLGTVLSQRFGISIEIVERVVGEQIEKVVYSLFAWSEGSFDFELQDLPEVVDVTHINPLEFMLEQGLNPQFLALEGTRLIDEMRHGGDRLSTEVSDFSERDSALIEENVDFAFNLLQHPLPEVEIQEIPPEVAQGETTVKETVHDEENRFVLLVDDDAATREAVVRFLESRDFKVSPFAKSEEALIRLDTLYRSGKRPVVLIDLIMPKMDGSGILGGLELVELIHANFPDIPVQVMADYHNINVERKVSEMNYPFILKPRREEIADLKCMRQFTGNLLADLGRLTAGAKTDADDGRENPAASINLGDELRLEMGDKPATSFPPPERGSGIALLRGILEELNNPSLGGGIILLVLRFASEFMNRAVIFIVKREEVVGLGQFGVVNSDGRADARVRNIRIPTGEDSIFRAAIDSQQAAKLTLDESPWHAYLFQQLGGGVPGEIFLGPIVSEGKVVALLYGDNLPEMVQIGDTNPLEIFLSQAGMAMERALLLRRLKE
jgi:CheY-like chemotaxis protein